MSVAYTSSRPSNFRYIPAAVAAFAACRVLLAWAHWLTCMRIDWCAWCAAGAQCCVYCKQRGRSLELALRVRRLETQPYSILAHKPVLTHCRSPRRKYEVVTHPRRKYETPVARAPSKLWLPPPIICCLPRSPRAVWVGALVDMHGH